MILVFSCAEVRVHSFKFCFFNVLFVSVLRFLQKSLIEISEENRQVLHVFMLVHVHMHICSCILLLLFFLSMLSLYGLPWWLSGKESACNVGAAGGVCSIPGSGNPPGGGHGNPLQ